MLATVVAVALVGLAARGDQGDTGEPALTLAPGTGQTASTIVLWLVALVGAGLLLLAPFAFGGGGGPRRERKKKSLLGQILALLLLVAVLWIAGDLPRLTTPPPDDVTTVDEEERPGDEAQEADDPPSPVGTLVLAGLGALAVAGAVALVVRSRLRRDGALVAPEVVDERVLVPVGSGPGLSERAAAEPDPRQAVLLAFAAAEERLGRPPATSPREWLAAMPSEPLAVLVGRYEVARFSHHDVTEADRLAALDALAALP